MEEETNVSEEYKKWFNRGYHLRSTIPQVFKDMTLPQNEPKEITQAFEAGRKQFEKEYGYFKEFEASKKSMEDPPVKRDSLEDRDR